MSMRWVNSAGGPLIVADEETSASWMGTSGLSTGDSPLTSDYARACAAQDHLELMRCAGKSVLVLGDEPSQSAFFKTTGGELAVVRWVYGRGEDGLAECLASVPVEDLHQLAPAISITISNTRLALFDTAMRGEAALRHCPLERIQRGLYQVTSETMLLKDNFHFIIHRFIKHAE